LVGTPVLGSIDPKHGLELLNVYVKAFFDTYLLQVDGTPSIEILSNDRELVTIDSKRRIR